METLRPIFVVGAHRSGTTLLRYMLNSHPRIFIPPESEFIPQFFLRAPFEPLSERRIAQLLDRIFSHYRFVRQWPGDRVTAAVLLEKMVERTPASFLDALYSLYAARYQAVRWGDKTPIYCNYMGLIDQLFPAAQFIHIVRDGRDVALSVLDKWAHEKVHVDLFYAAKTWVRRLTALQERASLLPASRFYEVRYEDLVSAPDRHLQALCAFLGEDYVPAMARPDLLGQAMIPPGSFHDPIRRPPSPERVGRWRREMSLADLRLFERIAAPTLAAYGYESAQPAAFSIPENVRFARLGLRYHGFQAARRVAQILRIMPPN